MCVSLFTPSCFYGLCCVSSLLVAGSIVYEGQSIPCYSRASKVEGVKSCVLIYFIPG